ncbi:MAG: hypothetical protein Fur0042_16400 [Cyanophyceae cyanobacterium]
MQVPTLPSVEWTVPQPFPMFSLLNVARPLSRHLKPLPQPGVALLVLLCGGSLSVINALNHWRDQQLALRQEITQVTLRSAHALRQSLEQYGQLSRSLGVLYSSLDSSPPEQFQAIAQRAAAGLPGIQCLAWFPIDAQAPAAAQYPPTCAPQGPPATGTASRMLRPIIHQEGAQVRVYRPILAPSAGEGDGWSMLSFDLGQVLQQAPQGTDRQEMRFYLLAQPVDYIHSALHKRAAIIPHLRFAFDPAQQTVQGDAELGRVGSPELLNGLAAGERACPGGGDWSNCLAALSLGGAEWTLMVQARWQPSPWGGTGAVLAMGLVPTLLLAAYLWIEGRRSRERDRLVTQLATTNRALEQSRQTLSDRTQSLETTLAELRHTQAQLIQTEKLSSIGQLVAGVAHEINNPVSFVYGNLVYAQEYTDSLLGAIAAYRQAYPEPKAPVAEALEELDVDYIAQDMPPLLRSMRVGAERIKEIVLSLRNFSRSAGSFDPIDLHRAIEDVLCILGFRLQATGDRRAIEIVRDYGDLPPVECALGQIEQTILNLVSNSIDALEELTRTAADHPPCIWIKTRALANGCVLLSVRDNGPGLDPHIQNKIFDPFFTTKPPGKGTGLGMAIAWQIVVEQHGGHLRCVAPAQGTGTEIQLELPVRQDHAIAPVTAARA